MCLTEHPLTGEIEASLTQLIEAGLSVRKFSQDDSRVEIMEDSCVQDAYPHTVDSDVRAQQDVPAIIHHSESTLAHRIAGVLQITLEQIDLAVMNDGIVLA